MDFDSQMENICERVLVNKKNIKSIFFKIAEQIFFTPPENPEISNEYGQIEDHVNWGRIVALLCFSAQMGVYCERKGICSSFQLEDWCAIALTKRAGWIKSHGQDLMDLMDEMNEHAGYENIWIFSILSASAILGAVYYFTQKSIKSLAGFLKKIAEKLMNGPSIE